jgi:predicted transcriptional regulator
MSRVIAATIRNGHAVADELARLPEGTSVEVVTVDDSADLELSSDEIAELNEAHDQADRGQLVPAAEVLRRLADRRRPTVS